jgi:hypothetical protein
LPCVKYKSYYHRFTAIKFAKPSLRSLQSVIPFIANPTELVGVKAPPSYCARPLCRLKAPLGLSLLRKCGRSKREIKNDFSAEDAQSASGGHFQ